jgi:hypothetical protein
MTKVDVAAIQRGAQASQDRIKARSQSLPAGAR